MQLTMNAPRSVKVGLGSAAAMVFGLLFGWVAFPKILHSQISKQMTPGQRNRHPRDVDYGALRAGLQDLSLQLHQFRRGHEGRYSNCKRSWPYYYEEWKEKVNMVDIEEEDAIYYNRRDTFLFKKEKSGPGLTGEEIIVMPNIFMLSTAITVARDKPAMLNLVGKAINGIFDNPESIFMAVKAKDILFDGIIINCDRTDFAPKTVCSAIKKVAKDIEVFGNNQIRFSIFGKKNGTIEEPKFKVLRGIRNIMDVGKVIEFNGETSQSIWGGPECNDFVGTDATVFPPFLTEKDDLLSFTPDVCRSLAAWYDSKSVYSGIPANRYVANLGDLANEPKWHCFCDTPTTCPPKGLMDVSKCLKVPLIASMPHFLDTDPKVLEGVKGLNPNVENHGITIDFEPITGTPLMAKKRLQFNIMLQKIEKLDLFKNLPNTLMPLFWVEEGLALNKTFISMLNSQLFIPMRVVGVVKWLAVCFGAIGVITAGFMHHKAKIISFAVSPSNNTTSLSNTNGKETSQGADMSSNGHALNGLATANKTDSLNQVLGPVERF